MSLELPPIRLEDLKPETRDWLIAKCAIDGKDPISVAIHELDGKAEKDGFTPKKAA